MWEHEQLFFLFSPVPTHTHRCNFQLPLLCTAVTKRNFSNFSCAELPSQTDIKSHCLSSVTTTLNPKVHNVWERRRMTQLLDSPVRRECLSAASDISIHLLKYLFSTMSRHTTWFWKSLIKVSCPQSRSGSWHSWNTHRDDCSERNTVLAGECTVTKELI